jgi:hypothetical protein
MFTCIGHYQKADGNNQNKGDQKSEEIFIKHIYIKNISSVLKIVKRLPNGFN